MFRFAAGFRGSYPPLGPPAIPSASPLSPPPHHCNMVVLSDLGILATAWLFFAAIFLICVVFPDLCSGSAIWRVVLKDAMCYGKSKQYFFQRPPWLQRQDLPKSWFSHFYVVSAMWNSFLLIITCQNLFFGQPFPLWLQRLLSFLSGSVQLKPGNELSVLLVQIMLFVQGVRRLIECTVVSVFSNGSIHPVQYCWGLVYYILVGLTVHCEGLHPGSKVFTMHDLIAQGQWYHITGIALFLWATIHHHKSHLILANLRKNKSGEVINYRHSIPHGDWFEFVSCPHYFAELLIYFALSVTFKGQHLTWWFIVLYVLCSHALMAIQSHEFYVKKFDNYPKTRKAFIPYIF
ncbi:polyprenal reductase [Hemitrygon akajei]|uniref:polyprenal reductase n=1 Tax=Hemitrygon akajei TaxID=2704970 RepID=UPI003BF99CD2